MKNSSRPLSWGVLAVIFCLALPAGFLSFFAGTTTGEQVEAADLIAVGRIASVQVVDAPPSTSIGLALDHVVFGHLTTRTLNLTVDGRSTAMVGDDVLVMIARRPTALLGVYKLRKDARSLQWGVVSPVTGMLDQGVSGGGEFDPIPLSLMEAAILERKSGSRAGAAANGALGQAAPSDKQQLGQSVGDDGFEDNDTLATASPITGLPLPTLVTGNPLLISGLTLTDNDVDFFSFDSNALNVLHAATLEGVSGLPVPDTLMGLFDKSTAQLLAWDDDSGTGGLSSLSVPIEKAGPYALAIESAPDTDLDFSGDEGLTTGSYSLSVELELGQYLWNQLDRMAGVSIDGTLIEDFVGYREIGGQDVLFGSGVAADGWAVEFDMGPPGRPAGISHVYGGAGDQLTDPGFLNPFVPLAFEIGPFTDSFGLNRRGYALASGVVAAADPSDRVRGVAVAHEYEISVGALVIRGDIALQMATEQQVTGLRYTRVLDLDLFGVGADEFRWSFAPSSKIKAFAVDTSVHVGNLVTPPQAVGSAVGDLQAALLIEHGDSNGTGFADVTHYKSAFTLVKGFGTANQAHQDAVRRLREQGVTTWVVAIDQDPVTGQFSACGVGLGL